jgi:hypothetical protein
MAAIFAADPTAMPRSMSRRLHCGRRRGPHRSPRRPRRRGTRSPPAAPSRGHASIPQACPATLGLKELRSAHLLDKARSPELAKNLPKTQFASAIAPDLQTQVLDLQPVPDGRGWNRTSDLPRVKRAVLRASRLDSTVGSVRGFKPSVNRTTILRRTNGGIDWPDAFLQETPAKRHKSPP